MRVSDMLGIRRIRFISLLLAVGLVVSVIVPANGGAVEAAPVDQGDDLDADDGVVTDEFPLAGDDDPGKPVSAREQGVRVSEAREWTREEMEAAKPIRPPAQKGPGMGARRASADPVGPPGGEPGQPPERGGARGRADLEDMLLRPAADKVPISQYTQFPISTAGRLFSRQAGKLSFCSASSIGNNAVWTAGHCVYTPEVGWHTNIVFVPSYLNGWALRGQWVEANAFTTTNWQRGDLSFDYGGVILRPFNANSPANVKQGLNGQHGQRISQVAGALGIAWNQPLGVKYTLLGYPGSPAPFDGNTMWSCAGFSFRYDDDESAPWPVGMAPCNQWKGASGGPWILWGTNWLGGNIAYARASLPKFIFSPRFTNDSRVYDTTDMRNMLIKQRS